ncbi:TPA: hypothetical protein L6B76_02640 [Pseudomonas aeruginosa]|nr:hypothetical protein [Pseudomonas aeruginosa]HBP6460070.1 hypothetical protein [Pseudomonas aeruginosa]
MITYGSVCSGIEAASVAWHMLGFRASWFAEIEPFPSAVLAHRWPAVPNLGDMTKLAREVLLGIIDASEDGTGRGQPIVAATLEATAGRSRGAGTPVGMLANSGRAVRRLTPPECERLQGFPDDYTLIPWAAYQKAMRAAEASLPRTATQDEVLRARIAALYACDVSKEAADECPDGPRYKAIGNSKAVPVVRWIGRRIQQQLGGHHV